MKKGSKGGKGHRGPRSKGGGKPTISEDVVIEKIHDIVEEFRKFIIPKNRFLTIF